MRKNHFWRITPNEYVAHHVQTIATREGRTLSNTLHRLLTEAIDARRAADQKVAALVGAIESIADAKKKQKNETAVV
jgi:hypothetical protein